MNIKGALIRGLDCLAVFPRIAANLTSIANELKRANDINEAQFRLTHPEFRNRGLNRDGLRQPKLVESSFPSADKWDEEYNRERMS